MVHETRTRQVVRYGAFDMVLGSQQARPGSRTYMYARRRRRRKPATVMIVIAVIVLGAWWVVFGLPWSESDEGTTLDSDTANASLATSNNGSRNGGNEAAAPNTGSEDRIEEVTTSQPSEHVLLPQPENKPVIEEPIARIEPETIRTITMGERIKTEPDNNSGNNASPQSPRNDLNDKRAADPAVTNPADVVLPGDRVGPDPTQEVLEIIADSEYLVELGNLVDARALYNVALHHGGIGNARSVVRQRMTVLNDTLIFSPYIDANDPFTTRHAIQPGDAVTKIARGLAVDWRFLTRINKVSDPGRIQIGQTLKIVGGPFHAVIDKTDFRLDLYIGDVDSAGRRMYIRSFRVGLGEYNSTPVGAWIVRDNSKLINPAWTNPRTGQHFAPNDNDNPIGERWIGLKGIDEVTSTMTGYGIHGTVDPSSIGQQASMGCVRMHNDDVELVYEVLSVAGSTIYITD